MNPLSEFDRYTPEQLDTLRDAARRDAAALREQAFGDFWERLGGLWTLQEWRARRAAERLAYRLARHARLRSAASRKGGSQACC